MVRKAPQLLKPRELEYIMQTATPGNECLLIEHIAAQCQERDRLVDALQQVRLAAVASDGFKPIIKLARIRMVVDKVLKEWQ